MHVPKIVGIKEIIQETENVKTFIFDWKIKDESAGQFMMLWNFEDEKPMSLSIINSGKNEIGITIKKIGNFTDAVHSLEIDDKVGLRGPYGRGFELSGLKILAIGGGVGMAPISTFVENARLNNREVDVIIAAKTKKDLLFVKKLKEIGANVSPATDDGSYGFRGFATDLAEKHLRESNYDMVVTCGPEMMMKCVLRLVNNFKIPAQFSIERWIKCGVGLCGQCCVDNTGWRVCVEGPVFWSDELKKITEFGKYTRDASGIKCYIP
jgi:dihydroorotate dehydrogenase electron transfer subunit